MNFVKDMADKVGDAIHGVVDKIEDMAEEALGKMFVPIMDKSVENSLKMLGPKAGEVAYEKMKEKYSALNSVSGAKDTAISAASEAVMSFKDEILDFCQEAMDDAGGAFEKVGCLLFKAAREAAATSVQSLVNALPGCCACCIKCFADFKKIIAQVYECLQQAIKDTVDEQLKPVPKVIKDKLSWDQVDADNDVGEPKKRRAAGAPAPQTMGVAEASG